jgi:hypothetical protein
MQESFEIRLRNPKDDQTVEVRVPVQLYRWSDREIITASMENTKKDYNTIELRAQVTPGEETVITYTVQYVFP